MFSFFLFDRSNDPRKINAVIYYSILCYIISLYLKDCPVVTNLLMVLIFVLAFIRVSPREYFSHFKKDKVNIGFVLFYLLFVISVLVSSDKASGMESLEMRAPLFILPLAFCLIEMEQGAWRKILLFYAFTTTVASAIAFFHGVYLSYSQNDKGYLYNDNIANFLGLQAVYMGFYVNAAVLIFLNELLQAKGSEKTNKGMIVFSLLWLTFIIFMLASKMSMLCLGIILVLMALRQIIIKKKFIEGALVLIGLIVGVVVFGKLFPKTMNRFAGMEQTEYHFDNQNTENHFNAAFDSSKWNSTNTRAALWQCGWEVWKAHFILGTGIGDKKNALHEKYQEKQFWYALNTDKHTHDQYLDIAVSMGIVGLLLFLFVFFIYPIKTFITQKKDLAIYIFACLALCLITENMLDRYQGEVIIAFLLPLATKLIRHEEPAQSVPHEGTY